MDTRALLKEIGAVLKETGRLPASAHQGARLTSAPLLDDGWMDFAAYGITDDQVGAIEHQLYAVPFVNLDCGREDSGAGKTGPETWTPPPSASACGTPPWTGISVTYANTGTGRSTPIPRAPKSMTVWFDFFSRHALLGTGALLRRGWRARAGAGRHRVRGLYREAGAARTARRKARLRRVLGQPGHRRVHQGQDSRATISPARRPIHRTIGCCTWSARATSKV